MNLHIECCHHDYSCQAGGKGFSRKYIRDHEQECRELADEDPEFAPLIDAMLEDVIEN